MDFSDEQLRQAIGFRNTSLNMTCPNCKASGSATVLQRPKVGDIAACYDCFAPLMITEISGGQLHLRRATDAELDGLPDGAGQTLRKNFEAIRSLDDLFSEDPAPGCDGKAER